MMHVTLYCLLHDLHKEYCLGHWCSPPAPLPHSRTFPAQDIEQWKHCQSIGCLQHRGTASKALEIIKKKGPMPLRGSIRQEVIGEGFHHRPTNRCELKIPWAPPTRPKIH